MNIHGTGCGLVDCIYVDEDFSSPGYQAAMSRTPGDGGLTPGQLVFSSALEAFMGKSYDQVMVSLNGGRAPSARNLGGPSAVSLAHTAQMLSGGPFAVRYFGSRGNDASGDALEEKFSSLPFAEVRLSRKDAPNSRVDVLSDPHYDNDSGERTFVFRKGSEEKFIPGDLGDDFFDAGLVAFGGTALTPRIHDGLTELLQKARNRGAVTEVNLVYDYKSEMEEQKWKLGIRDNAYPYIDILLADQEEAVKTSGKVNVEEAAAWFLEQGCGGVIITRGRQPLLFCASGTEGSGPGRSLFQKTNPVRLPVCEAVNRELAEFPERRGDTTGCGDNFTGMVIAELARRLEAGERKGIDLREICIPAVAAGGFACFIVGGTYYEKETGEKRRLLAPYIEAYRKQLGL